MLSRIFRRTVAPAVRAHKVSFPKANFFWSSEPEEPELPEGFKVVKDELGNEFIEKPDGFQIPYRVEYPYTRPDGVVIPDLVESLEWVLSTPPPAHQFEEPPIVVEIEHLENLVVEED